MQLLKHDDAGGYECSKHVMGASSSLQQDISNQQHLQAVVDPSDGIFQHSSIIPFLTTLYVNVNISFFSNDQEQFPPEIQFV